MSYETLRMQFIAAYLREGYDSHRVNELKSQLHQQGAGTLEIVELIIAAHLYGNIENFARKHPHLI